MNFMVELCLVVIRHKEQVLFRLLVEKVHSVLHGWVSKEKTTNLIKLSQRKQSEVA